MENRCCYDCLYHKRPKGISSCKKTKKEIPNPFETVCDKYQREQGGEIKEFKLSPTELAKYLEELQTKEVQYRGGIK